MDTFDLLPPLAAGDLQETSAPGLVAAVFRSRASGTLWLETLQGAEIRVFFRAGDMCGTAAFDGFNTLAHVLLSNDWVNALDIDSSRTEAAATKKRHGEVLVSRGLLTPEQLRSALAAQHRTNLATVLQLVEGKYDWRGWEPPPPWAREVVVDPVSCIVDALQLESNAARRKGILEWMQDAPARLSSDWPELQGRIELGPLDRRAAALLALPRKLDEFVHASRLEGTRAEALLVGLMLAGAVETQPQASQPPPEPVPEPVQEEALLEPEPMLEPELEPAMELQPEPALELHPEPALELQPAFDELPEPSLGEPGDAFPEPRLGNAQAAPDLGVDADLDERLDAGMKGVSAPRDPSRGQSLPPPAAPVSRRSAPPQRRAPTEDEAIAALDSLSLDDVLPPVAPVAAESLELDSGPRHHSDPSLHREEPVFDSGAGGVTEEKSRDMRKKMLARSMRSFGSGGPASEAPEAPAAASQESEPIDRSAELSPDLLSPEDMRFVDEVRSRAKVMIPQNAYLRLGVAQNATNEQIKAAYLTLAKRYHPDRSAQQGLAALQPELQKVFTALKEAYETIATPDARQRYEAQLKQAGGKPPSSRKEEAATAVKMGDVLLKKRDFEAALNKLRRAVDLDPTGDALAALAWGLMSDPKSSPAAKEEAASLINRALRAPGTTARTYYVAGVIWRTKDPDSAVDAFRKALELDPNHPDAALELRLIEQRRGKNSKGGGGVLSGLLFGKRKS